MKECMPFFIDGVGGGVTWWHACHFLLTGWCNMMEYMQFLLTGREVV